MTNMSENNSCHGAPKVMKARGRETDELIFRCIKDNQNATIREIAEKLQMTNGKVDGSVNRLLREEKVRVNHFLRNGKLIKRVSLKEISPRNYNKITIPVDYLEKKLWKDEVKLYALSRSAIGISPIEKDNWKKKAPMQDTSYIKTDGDKIVFELPDYFVDFYELPNSEIDISGNKDQVFISIQSTIIPVDLPSEYPIEDETIIIRARRAYYEEIEIIKKDVTTAEPYYRSDYIPPSEINKMLEGEEVPIIIKNNGEKDV